MLVGRWKPFSYIAQADGIKVLVAALRHHVACQDVTLSAAKALLHIINVNDNYMIRLGDGGMDVPS